MSGLATVIGAEVTRRRVQTVVMVLTTTMAVTASLLAAGLIVSSRAPFDRAFRTAHGAHLTARFSSEKASASEVAATAHAEGVSAAAGPYPVLSLLPKAVDTKGGLPPNLQLPDMTIVGRPRAGDSVDDLTLTRGRWATGPGEIVMSAHNEPFVLGNTLRFPSVPGSPVFSVVGVARSASETSDAWVALSQIATLAPPGARADYQMLYRFQQAATDAQLTADRASVSAAVPSGSLTGVTSYLMIKRAATRELAGFAPFVVAFGILGIVMSILVITIVVSGAVAAGTRRIGILKSLGFTPGQVIRAYLGQALIPGGAGLVLGVLLGNLTVIPVMGDAGQAYGVSGVGIPIWVDAVVVLGALAVIIASSLAPALRAGRLGTVEAIAVGRTPRVGRGRTARRLLGHLPLPRAVSLGLAIPFSRPARSFIMATAVAIGTIGGTFAIGLGLSLSGIQQGINLRSPGDVVVGDLTSLIDTARISSAIQAQPGTGRWFASGESSVGVAGLTGSTTVISYQGDSSWASWQLIRGAWFHHTGEATVPTGFLHATGTRIGDTITLTNGSRSTEVKIVGEVLAVRQEGILIVTDRSSIAALSPAIDPTSVQFNVQIAAGTDPDSYLEGLNERLEPLGVQAATNADRLSDTVVAMDALAGALTLLLLAVAGLGVLNVVVLDTRERVHDLGVMSALGMTPRQVMTMIITSVACIGLVSGAAGVPIGMAVHDLVLPFMARAAGTDVPAGDAHVYHLPVLVPLLLGGVVIATAGALLPAAWAARTRTAVALRTE
jgi:putative ABC transport system permease protein